MTYQEYISDFIHQRGSFSDQVIRNYVAPEDLSAARHHYISGCEILERAKLEDSQTEWERLMNIVKWHFRETDSILRKYQC
jgi:hypothetical protein